MGLPGLTLRPKISTRLVLQSQLFGYSTVFTVNELKHSNSRPEVILLNCLACF